MNDLWNFAKEELWKVIDFEYGLWKILCLMNWIVKRNIIWLVKLNIEMDSKFDCELLKNVVSGLCLSRCD